MLRDLVRRTNYGSTIAEAELQALFYSYIDTGLRGINNESVVYSYTESIQDYLKYIGSSIIDYGCKDSISECILLDSYASATIEGAKTTVEQVRKAYSNPKTKSDKMVVNAIRVQNIAYKVGISRENIRYLWERLVKGVCENTHLTGKLYRSGMVYISNGLNVMHTPEIPDKLDERMKSLFDFADYGGANILKACIIHFYFVYIHPFCDGNGRFARLWMNTMLADCNPGFKSLAISSGINARLSDYYTSIRESEFSYNNVLDITPFLEYMLGCMADMLRNGRTILTDVERKVLGKVREGITCRKLAEIMNYTDEKARRLLNSLVKKGFLAVNKDKRTYIYYRR